MYTYPNSAFYTKMFNFSYHVGFQQGSGQVAAATG